MSQPNFPVALLTTAEITPHQAALNAVITFLGTKFTNLTPEQRQKWGSIDEKNKLVVEKVQDYHNTQPALSVADVNWATFDATWQSRKNSLILQGLCENILELLRDPRTLMDFNLYNDSLKDYAWTQYKAEEGTGGPGYEAKYDDLKQFFAKNPTDGGETGS